MRRELGASIKIPPWGLNYILLSFFCFVSPLGILTLLCVGISGWDSYLSLHSTPSHCLNLLKSLWFFV